MNLELIDVLTAIAVGLGGTLLMDSWSIFLKRAFNIPFPNYCFVGRWLRYSWRPESGWNLVWRDLQ